MNIPTFREFVEESTQTYDQILDDITNRTPSKCMLDLSSMFCDLISQCLMESSNEKPTLGVANICHSFKEFVVTFEKHYQSFAIRDLNNSGVFTGRRYDTVDDIEKSRT